VRFSSSCVFVPSDLKNRESSAKTGQATRQSDSNIGSTKTPEEENRT
jgi:hypothetical protein